MNRSEKLAIGYTTLCHMLVHMLELTYGVVIISIRPEFQVEEVIIGLLANVLGFTFGLTSLPAGYLADRLGQRRLLAVCAGGMAIAAVATGLAPNVLVLGIALGFLGMAMGIFHPTAATFVSRLSRPGLGYGLLGVGGNLGLALGPITAGAVAVLWDWRGAYFVLAVPALILAILFVAARPDSNSPDASEVAAKTPGRAEVWALFKPVAPVIGLLIVAQLLNGLVYRGTMTYLPTHLGNLVDIGGGGLDNLMRAGAFTTVALLFGVFGQFSGGYLSERYRREKLVLIIALVSVPLLLGIGFSRDWGLLLLAIVFAFFHFMAQPVFNGLVAAYSPAPIRGTMFGVIFFFSFGLGSFAASLFGYVVDRLDTGWVFTISAFFELLMMFAIIALLYRLRRRRNITAP